MGKEDTENAAAKSGAMGTASGVDAADDDPDCDAATEAMSEVDGCRGLGTNVRPGNSDVPSTGHVNLP